MRNAGRIDFYAAAGITKLDRVAVSRLWTRSLYCLIAEQTAYYTCRLTFC